MSNRRNIRSAPEPRLRALVRYPAGVPAGSAADRVLRAPALHRRQPTVVELIELSTYGYDVVTGPRSIVVVDTAEGVRYENLHRAGWPDACDCGTPTCTPEAAGRISEPGGRP